MNCADTRFVPFEPCRNAGLFFVVNSYEMSIFGNVEADAPIQECINDVLSVPREKFLNIASKLDSLAFDDDPYEYHDNEGVESISDIADNLLNPTYRKAIIKALQDKLEYYAEDEFDDANIAERAKDILDNLAEIFGSDEQED